jgi:hypothetical protein
MLTDVLFASLPSTPTPSPIPSPSRVGTRQVYIDKAKEKGDKDAEARFSLPKLYAEVLNTLKHVDT